MAKPMNGIHNDQLRAIVKRAVAQGWTTRRSKKNHIVLTSPDGQMVVMPSTPSDWRSTQNAVAFMRRYGLT